MSEAVEYKKALPLPSATTQPFWDGCKRHELLVQKCKECGNLQFPPSPSCTTCMSIDFDWVKLSGKGQIYSHTVTHQQMLPNFDEIPYAVVIIELDESSQKAEDRRLRLVSSMVDCDIEDISIGMPVEVVFDDVVEDISLPKFRPVKR